MLGGMTQLNVRLCLSAQRALLGAVPHSLRAVSLEFRGTVLHFRAVFWKEPTDDEREMLSVACTEVVADFTDDELTHLEEQFLTVPPSCEPEHLAELVFLRAEVRNGCMAAS